MVEFLASIPGVVFKKERILYFNPILAGKAFSKKMMENGTVVACDLRWQNQIVDWVCWGHKHAHRGDNGRRIETLPLQKKGDKTELTSQQPWIAVLALGSYMAKIKVLENGLLAL